MTTKKTKTENKVKDRFTLYVKMEGTIKGKPRELVYRVSSNDADEYMNQIFAWAKEHTQELADFFMVFQKVD